MDILTIILACSLHPDDDLVRVLVDVASQKNVFFVGDLKTLNTYDKAASVAEAEKLVAELLRNSGKPAVGLMGVPLTWAARFNRSEAELFDACTNVAVATAMLSHFEEQCRTEHVARRRPASRRMSARVRPSALRACTLRRFGDELGILGYLEGVMKALAEDRTRTHVAASDAAQVAPVFVDGSDESHAGESDWSSPRLFTAPQPEPPQRPVTRAPGTRLR